jgi:hypothetical protein
MIHKQAETCKKIPKKNENTNSLSVPELIRRRSEN